MSRIMIVDDDLDILKYCDSTLGATGHEVVLCPDPNRALGTLEDHRVDLLVIDVVMPQMNGFEFLREAARRNPQLPPALMLTGRRAARDIKTALDLGATDYMVKPFDPDVFLSKLESILGLRPDVPAVRFAAGSTMAKAALSVHALVTSITEMGMTLRTRNYVERNIRIGVDVSLFEEIGIHCPPLRVVRCLSVEEDTEYLYEVFVSFIGLEEHQMRKIRRWISSRSIATRKAS